MAKRINVLGDIRAETDAQMLKVAFYETPDYRTLIESFDRPIIVGRRGTGKSALSLHLGEYWRKDRRTTVVEIVPQEDQVIGTRPLLSIFAKTYNQLKAGSRIAWKYALIMEVALRLIDQQKLRNTGDTRLLAERAAEWRKCGSNPTSRVRELLKRRVPAQSSPEETIAGLAQELEIANLQQSLSELLASAKQSYVFLIDQLDEGFEADDLGVALVSGFVHAAIDLNFQVPEINTLVFLRDNIFKAIAKSDPDYSKNIEGRFLRLHWDEHQLFDLVCARLKVAFKLEPDGNRKIWNRCTANELQEQSGFEKCLQLTLYRPRDLLSLLNEAFYAAQRQNRETLILRDLEATAKEISETRLDDLHKEYGAIIPILRPLTAAFRDGAPELLYKDVIARIEALLTSQNLDANCQREFAILEHAQEGIRILYSVGFLGIRDSASKAFVFCHDGRNPSKAFTPTDKLLIHPCYWMALNLSRNTLDIEEAAEIHDEYEVEVSSEAPEIRNRRIGQLMAKLDKIPVGEEGASDFEEWCLRACRIAFSGPLRNIELHPNKTATQRRDVIASNASEKGVWRRVLDDHKSRQVIFEVKNKFAISSSDYRQMLSYLHDDYGKLGFIVTRDKRYDLYAGPELDWTREMYNSHRVIIIKLTGNFLAQLLSKLRSYQKHDPCDSAINKILDTYTRLYLSNSKIGKPPFEA